MAGILKDSRRTRSWGPVTLAALLLASSLPIAAADSVSLNVGTLPMVAGEQSAVWADGVAYIVGGWGGSCSGGPLTQIVRFDPQTGQAAPVVAMREGLMFPSAVWVGGHMYIFGGHTGSAATDAILRYDPPNSLVDLSAKLPSPRNAMAAAYDGTFIWLFGGVSAGGSTVNDQILRFDPRTEASPIQVGQLPYARALGSAVWTGQHILLFGGRSFTPGVGDVQKGDILQYTPGDAAPTFLETNALAFNGPAVWDGTQAIVFPGPHTEGSSPRAYRPGTGVQLLPVALPTGAYYAAAWTGSAIFTFGGRSSSCWQGGIHSVVVSPFDSTPPTITPGRVTPPPSPEGWNNEDVTVTWECSDAGTGVVSPEVRVILSSDGAGQSATGTCTDNAGNTASATVDGINLDKTAPTLTGERSPFADEDGWDSGDVLVTFSCTDHLSGVARVTGAETVTTEGADQFRTGTCEDIAGNTASVIVGPINIDRAPVIDAVADIVADATGPAGAFVEIVAPATHDTLDGDGVASCDRASGTFPIGVTMVTCTAVDVRGNEAVPVEFTVTVKDITPPSVQLTSPKQGSVHSGPPGAKWAREDAGPGPTVVFGSVIVKAAASDSVSGVAYVQFLLDGQVFANDTQAPYEGRLYSKGSTTRLLEACAVDFAGNRACDGREILVFGV